MREMKQQDQAKSSLITNKTEKKVKLNWLVLKFKERDHFLMFNFFCNRSTGTKIVVRKIGRDLSKRIEKNIYY